MVCYRLQRSMFAVALHLQRHQAALCAVAALHTPMCTRVKGARYRPQTDVWVARTYRDRCSCAVTALYAFMMKKTSLQQNCG
jgi:hypothetical protein